MRGLATFILISAMAVSGSAATTVTLLHFSDYHSHALPSYSEDQQDQGGLARAIAYLKREKKRGALVFSGGDTMNKGAPAWSDKYQCIEWPWLNGVVDAMAFGNHDADYGFAAFRKCQSETRYPILSANTAGFVPYRVFKVKGLRIGVFAVAGADFPLLVRVPELRFSESLSAAREVVRRLREDERVDAVVLIGHQHAADDFTLARTVAGIDVIFGTHSHLKQPMLQIPGTTTFFISPYQYLTYISRIDLTVDGGRISAKGELMKVNRSMRPDRAVAGRIARLQRDLERDPQYRHLFIPIGVARAPLSLPDLGRLTVEVMRDAAKADVALATVSSFRQAIPPGPLNLEILRAALPYDNAIVVATMSGEELQKLLAFGESRKGSDAYPVVTSVPPLDKEKRYRVAATDYLATAPGYSVFFPAFESTGLRVRDELRKRLTLSLQ